MPGLSAAERHGCKKILSAFSRSDLLALNDTVTNRTVIVENTTEAIEAILSYTKDAEEFLKRKKVHRDVIFMYLANEGVVLPPNIEKHQLVKKTLEFWSKGKVDSKESNSTDVSGDSLLNLETLGKQFCQWFFQLLNSQNPTLGQAPQDWGPQHFWTNASLRLLSSTGEPQAQEFLGAELASLRLQALVREERLFFSPNLAPQGLKCISSPHGLVLVAVAGTIIRDQTFLGIFEQAFGLIRSPLDENSWKIKFTDLRIRGQDCVEGGASPVVTYDSSELLALCR